MQEDPNAKTLKVYAKHAAAYEQNTLSDFKNHPEKAKTIQTAQQTFLKNSLKTVAKTAKLFEIGSGYGRDALFIRSLGYDIQVSDAVDSFLDRLKQENFAPLRFNLITDDFPRRENYILANAVLVHFPKPEVVRALKKIYDALEPNGIFCFSLKQRAGGGEDYKTDIAGEKRYFSYWDIGEIEPIVEKTGFSVVSVKTVGGIRACWLDIIAKKPAQ